METQDATIPTISTTMTINSPLVPSWEEGEDAKSKQDDDEMVGGFLRPDYTPSRSSTTSASPKSERKTPAQRFTAWRGILRFRKSQQNLAEMANAEEE